jgi:hypothetical protein
MVDPSESSFIMFDMDHACNGIFHQLAFQIQVIIHEKNIFRRVVDKGALTCIMSIAYWKALGSPKLNSSNTMLKAFDEHMFRPHCIIITFPIE